MTILTLSKTKIFLIEFLDLQQKQSVLMSNWDPSGCHSFSICYSVGLKKAGADWLSSIEFVKSRVLDYIAKAEMKQKEKYDKNSKVANLQVRESFDQGF